MAVPGAVPAGMGKRLLAHVIDSVAALIFGGAFLAAAAVPALAVGLSGGEAPVVSPAVLVVGGALLLALGLFQWWFQGTRGYTVGKRLVGLRTLSARTGQPVGMGAILLRVLVPAAGALAAGLGTPLVYASPLFDASGRRQGWHDKAAGTMVFDVAVGVDPATVSRDVGASEAARRLDVLLQGSAGARPPAPPLPPAPPEPSLPAPVGLPAPALVTVPATAPSPVTAPATAPELVTSVPMYRHVAPGLDRGAGDRVRSTTPAAAPPPSVADRLDRTDGTPKVSADQDSGQAQQDVASSDVSLLLWDDRRIPLEGTALIGRDPAPRAGERPPDQVIAIEDSGRSVSKTHLLIGRDADGVWLKDRNSTNGTIITLGDDQQILCAAEQKVRVPAGASVAFGDYWFTVES